MKRPSREEICSSKSLWDQYVDPHAAMTEEEFYELHVYERMAIMEEAFGPEENEEEI